MVTLSHAFSKLKPFTALVLGDFLLDTYTTGKVRRVSPEAPVPVMEVLKQEARPGGAGNVVLNLHAFGAKVFCMGRIGEDEHGQKLKKLLAIDGTDCDALLVEEGYATPVKNRLIADSQQLLRVDFETIVSLKTPLEQKLIKKLKAIIPKVQIVALSDYGKGFLTNRLIASAIDIAKEHHVPVIVDPKGTDFTKYRGATIIKPNLSEAYAAAKMAPSASLDLVAKEIFSHTAVKQLLITRSEAGISLFDKKEGRKDFPVVSKEVKDVTGAGDTVLASLCLALANGLNISSAAELANIAAGVAIERLGCAQVTLFDLAKRLLRTDRQTKIFDERHSHALGQVLKGKNYSLLALPRGQQMTHALFRAIRAFGGREDHELIVYVSEKSPQDEFVHFLSSLNEIDYIVLQSQSLKHLCDVIGPKEAYVLKNEELIKVERAQNVLAALLDKVHGHAAQG